MKLTLPFLLLTLVVCGHAEATDPVTPSIDSSIGEPDASTTNLFSVDSHEVLAMNSVDRSQSVDASVLPAEISKPQQISEQQARKIIDAHGYFGIKGLTRSSTGTWRGTAIRFGYVPVSVVEISPTGSFNTAQE